MLKKKQKPKAVGAAVCDLKALPEEAQQELALYAESHSLEETVAWQQENGIRTGKVGLANFLSHYEVKQHLQRIAATVELVLAQMGRQRPDLTPERLHEIGQFFFSGLAIEQKDARIWEITRRVELDRQKLQLQRRRCEADGKGDRKEVPGISAETLEQIENELKLM